MNMKTLQLVFVFVVLSGLLSCRNQADNEELNDNGQGTPIIEFSELEHDFGTILEGEKVACVFTFSNKGDGSLVINSATTSCGCTVPEFDSDPIAPGEKGEIEVLFDSAYRQGIQNKTITIRSNAEKPVVILKIKAEVITNN